MAQFKCNDCPNFDTDVDEAGKNISWCDKLVDNVTVEEDGICLVCPINAEEEKAALSAM